MLLHICSFHPSTHRRWWGNTMGCYIAEVIARELKGINGHRNINMMRARDCSWLLTANMVITRLHRLPSERSYHSVQWFPSAPATGNDGRRMFEGVWWQCSLGMQRSPVCSCPRPDCALGLQGMKCWGQGHQIYAEATVVISSNSCWS